MIQRCIENSVAPGTLNIYSRVKARFLAFSQTVGIPAQELPQAAEYFSGASYPQREDRTLGYHVAALAHFFGPLPQDDADIQKALLRGANKTRIPVKHRSKASKEDVDLILAYALRTLLRVSEVRALQFGDFSYHGDGLWWIQVKRSKTDQGGQGATVAVKWGLQETTLWQAFCGLRRPLEPHKFLFSGTSGEPSSRDCVAKRIKKVVAAAGLQHKMLTSHSFRGGAATHAIRQGVDAELSGIMVEARDTRTDRKDGNIGNLVFGSRMGRTISILVYTLLGCFLSMVLGMAWKHWIFAAHDSNFFGSTVSSIA
ncbi:site-specific recombinase, phage integrase family [Cooperia oncophora]